MADLKTIEDLTNAFGPSGFEEEVVKAVQKHCEGLNLRNDAMYNVYATMPDAKGNRPVFMLDAHTDECGFMVQNVDFGAVRHTCLYEWGLALRPPVLYFKGL